MGRAARSARAGEISRRERSSLDQVGPREGVGEDQPAERRSLGVESLAQILVDEIFVEPTDCLLSRAGRGARAKREAHRQTVAVGAPDHHGAASGAAIGGLLDGSQAIDAQIEDLVVFDGRLSDHSTRMLRESRGGQWQGCG